jgi:hypothetical protein
VVQGLGVAQRIGKGSFKCTSQLESGMVSKDSLLSIDNNDTINRVKLQVLRQVWQ